MAVRVSAAACASACAACGSPAATRAISSAAARVIADASASVLARSCEETRTFGSVPGLVVPHRMRSFGKVRSVASLLAPKYTGSPDASVFGIGVGPLVSGLVSLVQRMPARMQPSTGASVHIPVRPAFQAP